MSLSRQRRWQLRQHAAGRCLEHAVAARRQARERAATLGLVTGSRGFSDAPVNLKPRRAPRAQCAVIVLRAAYDSEDAWGRAIDDARRALEPHGLVREDVGVDLTRFRIVAAPTALRRRGERDG